MGRKSLAEVRKKEILDAFEMCVHENGLEVGLEKVAQRAGVKRQIITHYFGCRDALEAALFDRISQSYRDWFYVAIGSLSGVERIDTFLDLLFAQPHESVQEEDSADGILDALWAAAPARRDLRRQMHALYEEFARTVAEELTKQFPDATGQECSRVAFGILALWLGSDSLSSVARFRGSDPGAARECGRLLIASLS